MEDSKQAEATKQRMQKIGAAREEQLDALKARLLAERCACPSHGLHQRTYLIRHDDVFHAFILVHAR